jgi:hypothetical protein
MECAYIPGNYYLQVHQDMTEQKALEMVQAFLFDQAANRIKNKAKWNCSKLLVNMNSL